MPASQWTLNYEMANSLNTLAKRLEGESRYSGTGLPPPPKPRAGGGANTPSLTLQLLRGLEWRVLSSSEQPPWAGQRKGVGPLSEVTMKGMCSGGNFLWCNLNMITWN